MLHCTIYARSGELNRGGKLGEREMRRVLHHTFPLGGAIRQLRPSDHTRFEAHLLRLDAESRRDRFNGLCDDTFVRTYADRCFHDGTTVIAFVDDEGYVRGAAELHERPEIPEPTAEIAFSVEKMLQHRGLGGMLFERLIGHAYALGYEKLLVTTHPQNEAMKALARRFNARLSFASGETMGVIDLAPNRENFVPFWTQQHVHPQVARD